MTTVTLVKDLPASDYYSGSGEIIIDFFSTKFIVNTKKALIKVPSKKSKARQNSSPTDQPNNKVVDLQSVEETFTFVGFLDDDESETAWNKAWKLRAMCSRGGPLKSLTIGDSVPIVFGQGDLWQPFLEENTFTINSDDSRDITATNPNAEARIEISFSVYFGIQR